MLAWSTEIFLLENFLGFGTVVPQASPRKHIFYSFCIKLINVI